MPNTKTQDRVIKISDVGTFTTYALNQYGDVRMTCCGGCTDVLGLAGFFVEDGMSDEEIEQAVYDLWVEGYEGDPEYNKLTVSIK